MSKKTGVCYKVGVILSFLAVSGIAEAVTGRGDIGMSVMFLVVGIVLCLTEYIR